ncbi:MAG TPA: hypothetical protein VH854_00380 [Thermoanaerobaculia bacterium]|jgi:hypothetical protein|nr:hypothetical protein [Thermoanaerobaculia bacterium]
MIAASRRTLGAALAAIVVFVLDRRGKTDNRTALVARQTRDPSSLRAAG